MPNRPLIVLLLSAFIPLGNCEAAPRGLPGGYDSFGDPSYHRARTEYGAVWHDFNSTAEALLKTIGATNAEAATLLAQVQTNAGFLAAKWDAWFRKHALSAQYTSSDN